MIKTDHCQADVLRNINYYDSTGRTEQSLFRPYSEETARKIDTEVQQIIDNAYEKTFQLLVNHQDRLHTFALLSK
ncbi:hypothetical protein [Sinomicrobium sp. M5D2P9]